MSTRRIVARTAACGAAVAALGFLAVPAASASTATPEVPTTQALSYGSVNVPICLNIPLNIPNLSAAVCI